MRKILPILLLSISLQSCWIRSTNQELIYMEKELKRCEQLNEHLQYKKCLESLFNTSYNKKPETALEVIQREDRIAERRAREKQEKLNPSQKQANTMAGLAMLANWLGSAYAIDYDQLDANMAQILQASQENQFYNTIFQSSKIGNTLHYDNYFSLEKNLNGTIDYLRLSNGQIIYAYPQSNTMGIIEFQNGLKGTLNSDGSFQFDSLSRPLESLDN